MDSDFMATLAAGFAQRDVAVARFEFPYMTKRRETEKRGGFPDKMPVLLEAARDVVEEVREARPTTRLFVGGKSLGGRVMSLLCDELAVPGLLCFGYPFHPPGKPSKLRTEHLEELRTPALFVQGTRDQFGGEEDVRTYTLAEAIQLHWLEDGDHGFKPRKRSCHTLEEHLHSAINAAVAFMESCGVNGVG